MSAKGKKNDSGKLRWSLLPFTVLVDVVKVLMFGAKKYGDMNWQYVKPFKERYFDAATRHILSWWDGEMFDPESGYHHLAHAICCLVFLIWGDKQKEGA